MFNMNNSYGQLLAMQVASAVGPNFGQILIVAEDSDNATIQDMLKETFTTDTEGRVRIFKTLEAAYAAAVSNNNDVILLTAHSTHTVAAGMAWSKSRINVIGMDGGDRLIQQGAKVQSTDGAGDAYVIKVTGTRNSFRNIKFIQVDTDAAALTVAQFGGEGTLVKNCSFTFGVADNLSGATTYEVVMGEDSGTFINCEFGSDTLVTSAARAVMAIDQVTTSQEMKDNRFVDCNFTIQSSDADANFVRILATTDLKFASLFKDCTFLAAINSTNSAVTLTDAADSVSSLIEGNVLWVNPSTNCTNFSSTTSDNFKITGTNPVAATAGVGVVPA